MRKVTKTTATAMLNGNSKTVSNTTVFVRSDGVREMFLHGNKIAEHDPHLAVLRTSLAGWGTPTTRERLNGLLQTYDVRGGYYQRNHEQRVDGNPDVPEGDIENTLEWHEWPLF